MPCVGLIGQVASGKSTVAQFFKKLGVVVISADAIARQLSQRSEPAFQDIVQHFGKKIIGTDGELNRRALRQIIFHHPEERRWLERLLHPLIQKRIATETAAQAKPYCVVEIPLLKSTSDYPYLQRILLVQSPPEDQMQRLMQRDNCSKSDAMAILTAQVDRLQQEALADDILYNQGSLEDLQTEVMRLHHHYLSEFCPPSKSV